MNAIYNIVISCPDKKGIVATVSSYIAEQGGFIEDAQQHSDHGTGCFFMRYVLNLADIAGSAEDFFNNFSAVAAENNMKVQVRSANKPQRIVLMVSKEAHCLEDILYRWQCKNLSAEVVAVISNHPDLRERTEWYGLPFYEAPIINGDKQQHFQKVTGILNELQPDLVVLARYMQVIPPELCEQYFGKMINIHHSFLPSFVGASPYKQAYEKGVKLIGATSHYVTADLDQGPIIEQEVTRISHRNSLQDYKRLGSDVERLVLNKALKAHLEDRVMIHGQKTVIFD